MSRRSLLLETFEDRILCSATAPVDPAVAEKPAESTADAPTAPAAEDPASPAPATDAALTSTVPTAEDTAGADPTQLTDEERASIESVVRDSTNQIWFEENVGQYAEGVLYGFRTNFGSMLVYEDHLQLISTQDDATTGASGIHAVDIAFTGSEGNWEIVTGGQSEVAGNYQLADGSVLQPAIFSELTLRNVYAGVDLRLYSAEQGTLEFDWIVAQAQDYGQIRMAFNGQDGITYGEDGSATLDLRYQDITLQIPETYQVIDGEKHLLDAKMVAGDSDGELRYEITGDLVADEPLVIDPNVAWATYIDLNDGALPFDSYVYAVAVNGNGVYVGGWMRETVTNGSFGNYMDVNAGFSQGTATFQNYIYRLNTAGTQITAWTSTGVVNDNTGVTNQKLNSATNDAISDLELFPDGRVLTGFNSGRIQIYAADLSTRSYNAEPVTMDTLNAVAIASDGSFYVSGRVAAAIPVAQIPAANMGPDATYAGGALGLEGVIVRYSNALTTPTVDWATYVGGSGDEYFTSIAMTPDKTRLVFATSTQVAGAYPALVNAVDSTAAGTTELLVGVLPDQAAKPAAFSVLSFLGGAGDEGTLSTDTTAALVTATNTTFYVAGNTNSTAATMPGITGGAQATNGGGNFDVFVSVIPLTGSAGTGFQTTYLGGSLEDNLGGIAYDTAAGRLLVFGTTAGNFPVLNTTPASNYYQGTFGGSSWDIFVATFTSDLTTKDYATYIGGPRNDYLGQTGNLIGQGHVFYSPETGLTYLATTVHSGLPAAVIGTPPGKDTTKSNGTNDSHAIFAFNINIFDYGDAPATYEGSPANAANSAVSSTLRIGATVDAEAAPASGLPATGDDALNTDDEDGIATLNVLAVGDTSYSTVVSVLNNSGASRTLQGWIDLNLDGAFQVGEYTSATVAAGASLQNVTLTWSGLPALTAGQSYLRLRLDDGGLTDTAGTAGIDERSIGRGGFGEVEDYALAIVTSSIAGTVYSDQNNNGLIGGAEPRLAGVTITLTGTNDLGAAVSRTTTTDASGNYSFTNLRPSNAAGYTITETQPAAFLDGLNTVGSAGGATVNNPLSDVISGVVLGANVAATGYNFGELSPNSLAGTVYRDLNNDGIQLGAGEVGEAGVTITLTGTNDLGAAVSVTTTTNASGGYIFSNLRPGTYTLTETQPASLLDGRETVGSQASGTINNTTNSNTISAITLGTGVSGTGNNFGELPASSFAGTVYLDVNNDGVQSGAGETGINAVTVALTGTDDRGAAVSLSTTTNASGAYSFGTLRPGTYTITETQPGAFLDGQNTAGTAGGTTVNNPLSDVISAITLSANTAATGYNFGELAASSLTGVVYRDLNNDGIQSGAGETAISGVTITLSGTNDLGAAVSATTTTDGTGAYSFANLRPGTYTLTETQPGGLLDGRETVGAQASGTVNNLADSNTISTITLGSGVSGTGNNFGELPASSLAGSVYGDLDGDGVLDAFESGVAGATVTLTGTDDRGTVIAPVVTTTNAAGAYSFANLRPGTYTITETQPAGYADGVDTIGTPGGTAGNDVLSAIALAANTSGANNNFGESPTFGLTKTLETTSVAGTGGSNLAVGEVATFRLVATIPTGTFTNFQIQDALPPGFQFLNNGTAVVSLVSSAGQLTSSTLSGAGLAQTGIGTPVFVLGDTAISTSTTTNADAYASGTDVFFKLGNLTNTDTNAATSESVVIEFQAVVVNELANQAATSLANTFSVLLDRDGAGAPDPHGGSSNTVTSTVAEPVLGVTKALAVSGTDAGDAVQYTITITNAAANNATAYDINLTDVLAGTLTFGSVSVSGATITTNTTAGNNVNLVLDAIAAGSTATVTINATVAATAPAGSTIGNATTVTWTSTPGANAGERSGAGGIDDYTGSASSGTFVLGQPTVDKLTPADTTYAVGETVTYDILVTLPEGVTNGLAITDNLPAGLDFVSVAVDTTGFAGTVAAPVTSSVGNSHTFTFGSTTATNDNNAANNSFLVRVTARVANVAGNQDAVTLTNTATLAYTDGTNGATTITDPTPNVSVTVVEPVLTLDKTVVGTATGLDAGDTVQYQLVITNTGTATAHEALLSDALPAGLLVSTINSTTLAGGATIDAATGGTGTAALTGEYTIPVGGSITILYTATLQSSVTPNTNFLNTATVTYSSVNGTALGQGTATGERTGSGGVNDHVLTDTAQVSTGGVLTVAKGVNNSTPAIGDVLTYTVTLTLNEGTTSGIVVTDTLPASGDLQFVAGSGALSFGTGGSTLSGSAVPAVSGNVLTFTLGDAVIPAGAGANTVVLTYQVVVANVLTNQAGDVEANSASVVATNLTTPPPGTTTVTLHEPQLTFSKTATAAGAVSAGDTVSYTLTFTNPGAANGGTAFDALVRDAMPADILITGITGTTLGGGATIDSAVAITGGGTGLSGQFDIPVGASVTINYVGTVQLSAAPGTAQTNTAELTWTSVNGGNSLAPDANERFGAAGGVFGDGSLNDYRLTGSQTVTVGTANFGKQLFATSDPATAGSSVGIGENVTYALVVTVPAGTAPALAITDTLPAGLQFVSSSIVTTAAASNGLLSADYNGTVPAPTVTGGAADGDDVIFNFGAITAAADGNPANNTFLVLVTARVTDIAGNEGLLPGQTALDNTATFDIPGDGVPPTTTPPVTVSVVEPVLTIDKEFSVTQADAGDTVLVTITVGNTGTGPVHDLSVTDVVDLTKFGNITAVTTPAGFTFNNAAGTVTFTGGPLAAGTSATFVFSVQLNDGVNPSAVLSNTASAAGNSQPGAVAGERSYGPVQDTDTLSVPAVFSLTKGIASPAGGAVQIGDVVTYEITVTLVEGTTQNIALTDTLPAGLTYVAGSATVSNANGMTVNGFAAGVAGNVLTITATDVVNPGNVDNTATTDSDTFTITYQAVVSDVAGNVSGTLLTNSLTGSGTGVPPGTPPPVTTTVAEPQLRVTKAVNDATADLGQTLHFTLTIQNLAAANGATAFDILVLDALPAGLSGLANITVTGAGIAANNSTATLLDLQLDQLALGATATVEFDATLGTAAALGGATIENNARIYWDSQAGESANSALTGAADGDGDRDYGAGAGTEVFDQDTDAAQDTERLVVNSNTISGVVYRDADASGTFNGAEAGVGAGVQVTLSGTTFFGEAFTQTVTADATTGIYTFTNVPRSNAAGYAITETQPAGFVDGVETAGVAFGGTVNNALGADTITNVVVPVGAGTGGGYNFGELLGSSLSGSTYLDANNDGLRQGGETGLGTALPVTLTGTDAFGQAVTLNGTSDAVTGAYTFTGLRPSNGAGYTITTDDSALVPATYLDGKDTPGSSGGALGGVSPKHDVLTTIVLAQGTAATDYNFAELAPATLAGSVFDDANSNGLREGGETGVANVTVTLTGLDDLGTAVNVTTLTNGTGGYSFTGLRPGTYTLTETQPAGYGDGTDAAGTLGGTAGNDLVTGIVVTPGASGTDYTFGEKTTSISGTVFIDSNANAMLDGTEAGRVGGVTVQLFDSTNTLIRTVLTAPDGTYSFGTLLSGNYTVTETQPNGYGSSTPNSVAVALPVTGATGVNFGETTGSLAGTVFHDRDNDGVSDAGEPALGGVTVTLTGQDVNGNTITPQVAVTAPDGSYTFTGLLAGTYTITETQPAGYAQGIHTAGTANGDTSVQDVIAGIVLPAANNATAYAFGERTPSDLVTTKTDNVSTVAPGQLLTYTITVSNVSLQQADSVVVTDQLPAGVLEFVSASDAGVFDAGTGTITWNLGALPTTDAAHPRITLTVVARVVSPIPAGTTGFTNTATATDPGNVAPDPTPENNTASDRNVVPAPADLYVLKTQDLANAVVGQQITYTITGGNAGGRTATGVTISDTLPEGLSFVSASQGGRLVGGNVVWEIGTLVPGQTFSLTVTVNVTSVQNGGVARNTVVITDDTGSVDDLTPFNNTSSVSALISPAFLFAFDAFHNFSTEALPPGTQYRLSSPEVTRDALLPLAPIYSGEGDPGSTLVVALYNAKGENIGSQTVVVDAGGNWLVSFPSTTMRDVPQSVRIAALSAPYSLGDTHGHNLRTYYSPALNPGHFFLQTGGTGLGNEDAPLLKGLGLENPLQLGSVKYGGELLSTQATASGY